MLYSKLCYESYAQRRGSNTFTLPLSEVKCALDVLILVAFTVLKVEELFCE